MSIKTIMILSENWELFDPRNLMSLVEAAQVAEAAGMDGVMVSEHIVMGPGAGGRGYKRNPREYDGPGNHQPDTSHPSLITMLGALAAATSRVKIYAGAILPVLRHPLQVAKDLATVDLLSKGRLVVLPTVSWHEQEYAALGVDFHKRGKMLDEQFEIWRKVWAETPASFHGEFYNFDDIYVVPKPWRPEGPPLWITGERLHKPALRRAIAYGSGFAPGAPIPLAEREELFEALAEAGRDTASFDLMGGIIGTFDDVDDVADLDAALERFRAERDYGWTAAIIKPTQFIRHPDELPDFCRKVVQRVKEMG
jgi:probable F420-dependent oxidoreductase